MENNDPQSVLTAVGLLSGVRVNGVDTKCEEGENAQLRIS